MTIDEIISSLRNLNLDNDPAKEVRELLRQVGKVGYMLVTYHKGKSVMRARPNHGDERFSLKDDFSFRPQYLNTTCQRASMPNQTMFYACALPDKIEPGELENSRVIGVLETMPWLRDKTSSGYKKISFGKWVVEEDLNLIAVVHKDTFYEESIYTRELVNGYNHFIKQVDKELLEKSLKYQTFIAEEFSKEISRHTDYLISAIFTEMVTQHPHIDGVLYPIVRVLGKGFNIAIKPSACKKLGLYVAGECSIYKLKDHTVVGNDCLIELDGKTDKFELKEIENHTIECLQQLGVNSIDEV
jgi:hypothetical protein